MSKYFFEINNQTTGHMTFINEKKIADLIQKIN